MTVKTNPIKLAWRVPRDNWHEYREGGINMTNALGEMSKVGEDASYVYLVTTAPYGNTDGNYWRWVNFGQWGEAVLLITSHSLHQRLKVPDFWVWTTITVI